MRMLSQLFTACACFCVAHKSPSFAYVWTGKKCCGRRKRQKKVCVFEFSGIPTCGRAQTYMSLHASERKIFSEGSFLQYTHWTSILCRRKIECYVSPKRETTVRIVWKRPGKTLYRGWGGLSGVEPKNFPRWPPGRERPGARLRQGVGESVPVFPVSSFNMADGWTSWTGKMAGRRAVAEPVNMAESTSLMRYIRYEHLVAGVCGGVSSTLILHPLDLLKIRFQGWWIFIMDVVAAVESGELLAQDIRLSTALKMLLSPRVAGTKMLSAQTDPPGR